MVARTKNEIGDDALRADLIELIETVIIYKLPRLSREEIEAMLQVDDIRKTRVFQEAKEEGVKEGIKKGIKGGIEKGIEKGVKQEQRRSQREKRRSVARLAAMNIPAKKIAEILELDIDVVRREMAKKGS